MLAAVEGERLAVALPRARDRRDRGDDRDDRDNGSRKCRELGARNQPFVETDADSGRRRCKAHLTPVIAGTRPRDARARPPLLPGTCRTRVGPSSAGRGRASPRGSSPTSSADRSTSSSRAPSGPATSRRSRRPASSRVEVDPADECPDCGLRRGHARRLPRPRRRRRARRAASRRPEVAAAEAAARGPRLPGRADRGAGHARRRRRPRRRRGPSTSAPADERTGRARGRSATCSRRSGRSVVEVPVAGVLHLKSAVTALPDGTIVGYPPRVPGADLFPGLLAGAGGHRAPRSRSSTSGACSSRPTARAAPSSLPRAASSRSRSRSASSRSSRAASPASPSSTVLT